MTKVITYGTFDLFHYGHLKLLERARSLGDWLAVGVSSNEFNSIKNKKCIHPYEERSEIVSAIKYVDFVFPENNWEQKINDIKKYNIDIFTMGDDWIGKFDFLSDNCKVEYLSRTPDISSTEIKSSIKLDK